MTSEDIEPYLPFFEKQAYRQTLISDLILHDMPVDLLREISNEIDTKELEHMLALLIESRLVKNNVEIE